ncbi:hypothetical protein GTGU_04632, partial [Trabulsiella guamensis ATCC 49490]
RLARLAEQRESGEIGLSGDAIFQAAIIIESLCGATEKAVEGIERLERSETQLIDERDMAETALADMYMAVTGEPPEWSNHFTFGDAVERVKERLTQIESMVYELRDAMLTLAGEHQL